MKSTVGRPRVLTDAQIAEILLWHDTVTSWRSLGANLKSRRQLATELGVSLSTFAKVIKRREAYKQPLREARMGRPRVLRNLQIDHILRWHDAVLAWQALGAPLKSRRQLANELGVSPSTITCVSAQRGTYKQPSPEARSIELDERSQHLARLRRRGML